MNTQISKIENIFISSPHTIDELVINWHITEACNYNCSYCFAKWGKPNELHRCSEAIENLLDKLSDYFIKGNSTLKQNLGYSKVRLNIAGGEPMLLGNKLSDVLILAKRKGFHTSIITNGHYLLDSKFDFPNDVLDMVGVSFDSQNDDIRTKIGRADRKGDSLNPHNLKRAIEKLSSSQHGIKIKINTVVNKFNWQEDFSRLILEINPEKWKILQVMPYENHDLVISKEQFSSFIEMHRNKGLPIYAESNIDMTESYLMLDPKGRLYQNSLDNSGYIYSDSLRGVEVEKALKQINFNDTRFSTRYLSVLNSSDISDEDSIL